MSSLLLSSTRGRSFLQVNTTICQVGLDSRPQPRPHWAFSLSRDPMCGFLIGCGLCENLLPPSQALFDYSLSWEKYKEGEFLQPRNRGHDYEDATKFFEVIEAATEAATATVTAAVNEKGCNERA